MVVEIEPVEIEEGLSERVSMGPQTRRRNILTVHLWGFRQACVCCGGVVVFVGVLAVATGEMYMLVLISFHRRST